MRQPGEYYFPGACERLPSLSHREGAQGLAHNYFNAAGWFFSARRLIRPSIPDGRAICSNSLLNVKEERAAE